MVGRAAFGSIDGWQRFSNSARFSVLYPGTWVRNGVSTDRLQLLSSKGGAEGIGIKQGQAEITVMEAPESSKQTLAQVIAFYTQDTTVFSHKDVPREPGSHGCSNLKEVTSKEPAIPPADSSIKMPNIINTYFFCEADGRKIVALLRNWEGIRSKRSTNRSPSEWQRVSGCADTTNHAGKMIITIFAGIAEFERDRIRGAYRRRSGRRSEAWRSI